MCGILGVYSKSGIRDLDFNSGLDKLYNRGPDGLGTLSCMDGELLLGHTRLAIQDLTSNGGQPMVSYCCRYSLIFNGEIYNHEQLREKYKILVDCRSDTRTLIELISELGVESALNEIKGMFAFALFDKNTRKLTLARDISGEKPLYWGIVDEKFVFGSDLSAIKCVIKS